MSHLDVGLMHELLDGEIPSSELAPIQAHLASCAECRARFDEERALLAGTDELIELLEVPAAASDRDEPSVTPRRRIAWVRDLAWAASIVLAVGIGYALRGKPMDQQRVPTPSSAQIAVTAPSNPPPAAPPAMRDAFRPARPLSPTTPAAKSNVAVELTPPPAAAPPPAGDTSLRADPAAKVAAAEPRSAGAARAADATALDSATLRRLAASQARETFESRAIATGATTRPPDQVATRGRGGGGGRGGAPGFAAARPAPIDSISLPDAMRRLGGTLRFIDGLVPVRLEFQEPWVRVVYTGDIVLQQQLIDGHVVATVVGPRGFRPDSLARLQAKVRE